MNFGIGLGSNLGDRLQNLRQALVSLRKIHSPSSPPLYSETYLSQAVDCEQDSPAFYNMAIELECELEPLELLSQLRNIELNLGRPSQRQRNASRTIDLDILYAGELVLDSEELTLPHPRFDQRRFVLQPLADIRPELILPGQSKNISTLLVELKSDEAPLEVIASHPLSELTQPTC